LLEGVSALIVDLDGVVWLGKRPIEGAAEALRRLEESGKRIAFLTNNSTLSRRDCIRRLGKMGIRTERVITSSYGAALWVAREGRGRVYAIGERGLREELRLAGHELVGEGEAEGATHVVVGLDRRLNYGKLAAGMRAILSGAKFIATNRDCSFPTEEGLLPGAGAVVSFLEAATSRPPDVVIGKPEPFLVELALKELGSKRGETALIGDRMDTDVVVGKRMGLLTILVLTGVSKEPHGRQRPDLVVKNLSDLL
jgi:HAD superfamily hydrolase (TIGR01457 family)